MRENRRVHRGRCKQCPPRYERSGYQIMTLPSAHCLPPTCFALHLRGLRAVRQDSWARLASTVPRSLVRPDIGFQAALVCSPVLARGLRKFTSLASLECEGRWGQAAEGESYLRRHASSSASNFAHWASVSIAPPPLWRSKTPEGRLLKREQAAVTH